MDFVRNLEGKRWWIDGFHGGGKPLERGTTKGKIWGRNEGGGQNPQNFISQQACGWPFAGASVPNYLNQVSVNAATA